MPTNLPACATGLTALTTLTCATLYESGGLDARIYIGDRSTLASITYGTNDEITAITLTSPAKLVKVIGKPYENTASSKDAGLSSSVNLKTHEIVWQGNAVTAVEIKALKAITQSRNLFAIVEKETGGFLVFGLDKNPATGSGLDSRRGLKGKADFTFAKSNSEMNTVVLTLTSDANMYDYPVPFAPASSNATNITTLDGLC